MIDDTRIINEDILKQLNIEHRQASVNLQLIDEDVHVEPKIFQCSGLMQLKNEIKQFTEAFPHRHVKLRLLSDGIDTDISIEIQPIPNVA